MGFGQSRFHEAVSRGNQPEAYALYFHKKAIRDGIQPNSPLGTGPNDNSALHYAALFAMKQLYMDLVNKGGKPDMKVPMITSCFISTPSNQVVPSWVYNCCFNRGKPWAFPSPLKYW